MTYSNNSAALQLLSDELSSWSQPEMDTAFRLEHEAQQPVVEVPGAPDQEMAKVVTLVSRLRQRPIPFLRQAASPSRLAA